MNYAIFKSFEILSSHTNSSHVEQKFNQYLSKPQLNYIYYIELHVSTCIRLSSVSEFVFKT